MSEPGDSGRRASGTTLALLTGQGSGFFFQVPAVRIHSCVLAALGVPEMTLVTLRRASTGKLIAAWAVGGADGKWPTCATPWHRTVQMSVAAWRDIAPGEPLRSGEAISVTFPTCRMPVRPARVQRLLAGDELGLHADDAAALGVTDLAFVNYDGIPGAFRVVLSARDRDRGFVRLSYQARMLLGVPERRYDLLPEPLVGPWPRNARGDLLLVGEPRWEERAHRRSARFLRGTSEWAERASATLLRAPEITFLTVEALPGEDHMRTVRLATELFPLLGTRPGQQVYVASGQRNRVVATALTADPVVGWEKWAKTDVVGDRPPGAAKVPAFATVRAGAEIRAALGIPRSAVVTVRRRVSSLILGKLNELIIPATGLFIALSVDVRLSAWMVTLAVSVVLVLLLAPLRIRRNPRGRLP